MKGQFKTFMTLDGQFATIMGGEIITSEIPIIVFPTTATMEAAEFFFPKQVKNLKIVTIEYKIKN